MRFTPALAIAISPKSNPDERSLLMSSKDLTGAPYNIVQPLFTNFSSAQFLLEYFVGFIAPIC
jgi:hypothetical protein